jgi:hypothetical protein
LTAVYELAGEIGLDPAPFSLRELVMMAKGRRRSRWMVAACMMAANANLWRDKDSKAAEPRDFLPNEFRLEIPAAKPIQLESKEGLCIMAKALGARNLPAPYNN